MARTRKTNAVIVFMIMILISLCVWKSPIWNYHGWLTGSYQQVCKSNTDKQPINVLRDILENKANLEKSLDVEVNFKSNNEVSSPKNSPFRGPVQSTLDKSHQEHNSQKQFSVEDLDAPIDLDVNVPPIDLLYEKMTLVTGFSENHFREGLGFIGSAQRVMPGKKIIVYDLGLLNETVQVLNSLCNVEVRPFPFENYPSYYQDLRKYAFKATLINLALNEFGVIYYGDSSIRLHQPLKGLIPNCLQHHGFVPHIRCFNPKISVKQPLGCTHDYVLTRKEVYPFLGVDQTEYYNANFSAPAISAGLMMIINNTVLQTKLMKPWLECTGNEDCIAPPGATKKDHRFEQAALTILVFKNMRGEWTLDNDPTGLHLEFASIERGPHGELWQTQSCN